MFPLNLYRWDFPQIAALVAPRPLLIGNTDKDPLFPLDGVVRVYEKVRRIYRLYGAESNLGLLLTEGGHDDTQDLQVPALRWMNRHLKGENGPVENYAVAYFNPEELKVFDRIPDDERNTTIEESFVPPAEPPTIPASEAEWEPLRDRWRADLRSKPFGGWPSEAEDPALRPAFSTERDGVRWIAYDFNSQPTIRLRLYLARPSDAAPSSAVLTVFDDAGWDLWSAALTAGLPEIPPEAATPAPDAEAYQRLRSRILEAGETAAWIAPRGIGPTAWSRDRRTSADLRRRFMLLGQTLDGMRVWDVRQAVRALRSLHGMKDAPITLSGERDMAAVALYAGLFEPGIAEIRLQAPPITHREGPDFLHILRYLDTPQAVAMAAERSRVRIEATDPGAWAFPQRVRETLGWPEDRLTLEATRAGGGD
jgi:hypothetical protein